MHKKNLLAAALTSVLASTCVFADEDKVVYFYNWSEYMPQQVLEQFEAETGIKVVYTSFDSNEAMYAKLRVLDEGSGYDLAVPSTYYVNKMRNEGLLQAIDKTKLSHYENLDTSLLNKPFDPNNTYSVPYLWGSTGIAVNSASLNPADFTRWQDLWKPELRERVMLTNDMREVFGMALMSLGYSGNDTQPEHIRQAYEKLRELVPNVRTYNSDAPRMPYLEGETDVGLIWNGEAYMAQQEDPNIQYIYPKEGVILWMDNLVIPKQAKHVEAAHTFIDFLLRPEIAKLISEEIGYATPNQKALTMMDASVRNNPVVYPEKAIVEKGEFQQDIGEALSVYEKYWELLKASH